MYHSSKVKVAPSPEVFVYKWINGNNNSTVSHSVVETLNLLGWEIENKAFEALLDKVTAEKKDEDEVTPEDAIEEDVEHKKPSKELI